MALKQLDRVYAVARPLPNTILRKYPDPYIQEHGVAAFKQHVARIIARWGKPEARIEWPHRTGDSKRPIGCPDCSGAFADRNTYIRHYRTHMDEFHLACGEDECNYKTYQSSNFINHLCQHCDYKPFACAQCGRKFATAPQLCEHRREHKAKGTQGKVAKNAVTRDEDTQACPERTARASTVRSRKRVRDVPANSSSPRRQRLRVDRASTTAITLHDTLEEELSNSSLIGSPTANEVPETSRSLAFGTEDRFDRHLSDLEDIPHRPPPPWKSVSPVPEASAEEIDAANTMLFFSGQPLSPPTTLLNSPAISSHSGTSLASTSTLYPTINNDATYVVPKHSAHPKSLCSLPRLPSYRVLVGSLPRDDILDTHERRLSGPGVP